MQIPPQSAALLLARDDEPFARPDQVRVQPGRVDGGGEGAGQFGERPVVLVPASPPGDLQLADDGRGAGEASSGGSGLETMRERAEELGGSLELLPRAGGGTLVRAILPRDPS